MRILIYSLFLLALVFQGCASREEAIPVPASFSTLPAREQEFYVDAYQEMFAWRGDAVPDFARYFITFQGKDAPADLLAQLGQKGYKVLPGSQWKQGKGMRCEAEKLEWLSSTRVRFRGGWLYGSVGGQWGFLFFVKIGGALEDAFVRHEYHRLTMRSSKSPRASHFVLSPLNQPTTDHLRPHRLRRPEPSLSLGSLGA